MSQRSHAWVNSGDAVIGWLRYRHTRKRAVTSKIVRRIDAPYLIVLWICGIPELEHYDHTRM
jgi:hypothetical protein